MIPKFTIAEEFDWVVVQDNEPHNFDGIDVRPIDGKSNP